jgi:hypothetical protein
MRSVNNWKEWRGEGGEEEDVELDEWTEDASESEPESWDLRKHK